MFFILVMKPPSTAHKTPSCHSEVDPRNVIIRTVDSKKTSPTTSENDFSLNTSEIPSVGEIIIDEEAPPGVRQAEAVTRVWNQNTLFVAYAWLVDCKMFPGLANSS